MSDTPDVQQVILGEGGVLHGARPGSLVVDCSTISPTVTRDLAAALAVRGVDMLDAPISGGSERPGFTVALQQKDLRLVLDTADALGVPLPGTALIFQLYRTLEARGLAEEGNHALVKALEALSGFEVGTR